MFTEAAALRAVPGRLRTVWVMASNCSPLVGSHVPIADPLSAAAERGAAVIQVHLSAPQQWRAPKTHPLAGQLADSEVPLFVHAPYLINCSSVRPELRARSTQALRAQLDAAAVVGASGVVVHAGHPTGDGTVTDAVQGWLEVLDRLGEPGAPLLVENTAGGRAGPGRTLAGLEALFSAFASRGHEIGFCLDTCHAHAAGLDMRRLVTDVRSVTGRVDLVHLNDSKDPAGSGRDRHENLGAGHIDPAHLVEVAATAGAPCVVETPGGADSQRADIDWVRGQLAAAS